MLETKSLAPIGIVARWIAVGLTALSGCPAAASPLMLASGDSVRVIVRGEDQMSQEALIDADGAVRLPFAPRVLVDGLTVDAAAERLAAALKAAGLLRDAEVFVEVTSYRPVYLVGAVGEPGAQDFAPGMTVRQAVALAGGLGMPLKDRPNIELLLPEMAGQLAALEAAIAHHAAVRARLDATIAEADDVAFPALPSGRAVGPKVLDEIERIERDRFAAEETLFDRTLASLDAQIALTNRETAALRDQMASVDEQVLTQNAELGRISQLFSGGLASQDRVVSTNRVLADLRENQLQIVASLARVAQRSVVLEDQRASATTERRGDALTELSALTREASDLHARRAGLLAQMRALGGMDLGRTRIDDSGVTLLIHRRGDDGEISFEAGYDETVLPGDVIEARLKIDADLDFTSTER